MSSGREQVGALGHREPENRVLSRGFRLDRPSKAGTREHRLLVVLWQDWSRCDSTCVRTWMAPLWIELRASATRRVGQLAKERQPPYGVLGCVTWLTTRSCWFRLSIVNGVFVSCTLATGDDNSWREND